LKELQARFDELNLQKENSEKQVKKLSDELNENKSMISAGSSKEQMIEKKNKKLGS